MNHFYITTPIYYVNDKPHIGHAYTTILADVIARYRRQTGDHVFFLTGLDEHGQKVQHTAEKSDLTPKQHCDQMAPHFLNLWKQLQIKNDDFIRTTEPRHKVIVQQVLQAVYDAGDIYKGQYEGWYSVSEERFITDKERASGEFRDLQRISETNYYFRMEKYQGRLIEYIEQHPEFILPATRRNEILGKLREPIGDLCISRPKNRLSWGIDVPFDSDFVTYVWFDALLNYISVPGYGSDDRSFQKWWPADCHLIGKDILMTHAIYWPTMLFSAGIPLPKTIFAHGWWLSPKEDDKGLEKMSKSLGNVVNPLDLIDRFGVDSVRYYLMKEMVPGQDAYFSTESFLRRYNGELGNDLGNCIGRIHTLISRNFEGKLPDPSKGTESELDRDLRVAGEKLLTRVANAITELKVNEAIGQTMEYIKSINVYLARTEPWRLLKSEVQSDKDRAAMVLFISAEALRLGIQLLNPVMPQLVESLLPMVGDLCPDYTGISWGRLVPGTKLAPFVIPFPKIEG